MNLTDDSSCIEMCENFSDGPNDILGFEVFSPTQFSFSFFFENMFCQVLV